VFKSDRGLKNSMRDCVLAMFTKVLVTWVTSESRIQASREYKRVANPKIHPKIKFLSQQPHSNKL
jgi:hypothetical protein